MRKILLTVFVMIVLSLPVFAVNYGDSIDTSAMEDALTEEQKALMGEASPLGPTDFLQAVQQLISRAVRQSRGMIREAVSQAAVLLGICLLCGLCGTADTGPVRAASMAGVVAVVGCCTGSIGGMIRLGADTVRELTVFSQFLFPVLAASAAAAGAVTSAPALYGVTVLVCDLLLALVTQVLVPALYLYLAMAAADCVLGNAALKRLCGLILWAVKTGLKTVLYVFSAFLTLTQVISGSADAMTTKAARLTLSSMVPVVGSILSDASETLLVSASLIRNSVGVFGLLAVLAVCILPFLRIGAHYLALRVTAAVSSLAGQAAPVRMVEAMRETMGLLLAMTGTAALLLMICVVCTLKTVGLS